MERIRIAIVDDQQLFRQGLAALIHGVDDFAILLQAGSGKELLDELKNASILPQVLLMDMKLPDMNGVELNAALKKIYPAIKVIVLSMYEQERFIYRMIEAGASGYLVKNCTKEELITAIKTTMASGFYFNQSVLEAIRHSGLYKNQKIKNINGIDIELTKREEEILIYICKEYNSAQIADKLFLSSRTVEGHRNNLLLKTGCSNTAGLLLFAIRNGIFDPL